MGQIAECRDRIAGREHRDAERERAPPAPCRRVFDQIIGQHQIAGESRHIVERGRRDSSRDAQNPRISVIARIAEHGAAMPTYGSTSVAPHSHRASFRSRREACCSQTLRIGMIRYSPTSM